jgi:flagellin-like protein
MVFNKKAISPVVATALLLVVAVVAVVGFQSWFTTFQSKQLTDVELQTSSGGASIAVERVQNNSVYILNRGATPITATGLTVNGNADYLCTNASISISPGVSSYDCPYVSGTYVVGEKVSVLIETSSGLVSADALAK